MSQAIKKYETRVEKVNSLVCVGLDPEINKLPEEYKQKEFPQFEFNKFIIDQTAGYVSAYKPNIAFYESRGEQGLHELKLTIDYLHQNHDDIFTICDAKRGDIGNTNEQYAIEIFDMFGFDAVTAQPYMGRDSLEPFLNRKDKATIILCRTSNPGAREIQDLVTNNKRIWQVVAEKIALDWNYNNNCMAVVGATYPDELKMVRSIVGDMVILVPGIGAQGGDLPGALEAGKNSKKGGMVINSARGIIFAQDPGLAAKELRDEINRYRI